MITCNRAWVQKPKYWDLTENRCLIQTKLVATMQEKNARSFPLLYYHSSIINGMFFLGGRNPPTYIQNSLTLTLHHSVRETMRYSLSQLINLLFYSIFLLPFTANARSILMHHSS